MKIYRSIISHAENEIVFRRFQFLVPLTFGFWSLLLGQDSNYDLLNYHLYTPFAFLNNKLEIDLAAAGGHSYFNPFLDLPYYFLIYYFPPYIASFIMGCIHGLNFNLVLGISSKILSDLPPPVRNRVCLFLSLSGCLTANFLSGLGNSMGDCLTSLFVLCGFFLVLKYSPSFLSKITITNAFIIMLIGLVIGIGAGLKLTNVPYVAALCFSILFLPCSLNNRLVIAILIALGICIGITIGGGYWYFEMWNYFGNPVFPMFSNYFPNELSGNSWSKDNNFLPKNIQEILLWPLIFSLDSYRVGQAKIHQFIWPLFYLCFIYWIIKYIYKKIANLSFNSYQSKLNLFLILFIAVGYILWQELFSISRYLVPIELLAPLGIYVMSRDFFAGQEKLKALIDCTLMLSTLVVLLGGYETYGHVGYGATSFRVIAPKIEGPRNATVLFAGTGASPQGWMVTQFPSEIAFSQLGAMEDTDAYNKALKKKIIDRGGNVYAFIDSEIDFRRENVELANSIIEVLQINKSLYGCKLLISFHKWRKARSSIDIDLDSNILCKYTENQEDIDDIAGKNLTKIGLANLKLKNHGFELDKTSCTQHDAFVGRRAIPYQFCKIAIMQNAIK